MNVELIANTPEPEAVIEQAARICYMSKPKDLEARTRFLQNIIKSGHESVIEHASATFKITGVSRSLTHQLVRHRIASYSQQSQRYCSFEKISACDDIWYVTPPEIAANETALDLYEHCMNVISDTYLGLSKLGIKNEDCRFVLPNSCKTQIFITMNFRSWRHFIKLRLDPHAQWEIRAMAKQICFKLNDIAPVIFDDIYKKMKNE